MQIGRFGVNRFAFMNPDLAAERTVGNTEHGRTLRDALQLNDIHQALALDAAKTGLALAPEERLDAFEEHPDFFLGGGLVPEKIHAQGIHAGAELFVHHRSERDGAELGIFAADDGEDLEAVHLGHLEIANQKLERLGFEHGHRFPARIGDGDFRMAGKLGEHLAVQLQQVRIVIQQQDFVVRVHCSLRQGLAR